MDIKKGAFETRRSWNLWRWRWKI